MDQVWILDLVTIRFEDLAPLLRVAVLALGDFRQAVTGDDGVAPHFHFGPRARRGARAATSDIGKVRLGLIPRIVGAATPDVGKVRLGLAPRVVFLLGVLVEESHISLPWFVARIVREHELRPQTGFSWQDAYPHDPVM